MPDEPVLELTQLTDYLKIRQSSETNLFATN
jgi:hypothetical protein